LPRDLKHLLVVVCEDRVITHSTNVLGFHKELKKIKAINDKIGSYSAIKSYFKKKKIMELVGSNRKIYTLQRLI